MDTQQDSHKEPQNQNGISANGGEEMSHHAKGNEDK